MAPAIEVRILAPEQSRSIPTVEELASNTSQSQFESVGRHVKMDKGPLEYLRALASGDPERIQEALAFQRESFRAKFGCYPEELKECTCGGETTCTCPGWDEGEHET